MPAVNRAKSRLARGAWTLAALAFLGTASVVSLRYFWPGGVQTLPYYALCLNDHLRVSGRVIRAYDFPEAVRSEAAWRKIVRNVLRMGSRELVDSPAVLEIGTMKTRVMTDTDGFVRFEGSCSQSWTKRFQWRLVSEGQREQPQWARGWRIGAKSGLVVISDLDDTLIVSNVADKLGLLKRIIAKESFDLEAVPGASTYMNELKGLGAEIIYLSASPWNFHDQLTEFLHINGFPEGPLILRNFGIGSDADPMLSSGKFKAQILPWLIEGVEARRIMLLGDSGEYDPQVYWAMREKYPEASIELWIRDVGNDKPMPESGITVFKSYAAASAALKKMPAKL